MTRNDIQDYLKHNYPNDMDKILLADGLDDAFIGIEYGTRALYDIDKCVDILTGMGMDEEKAISTFEFREALFNADPCVGRFGRGKGEHRPQFIARGHQSWLEYNEGDVNFYSDWAGEE